MINVTNSTQSVVLMCLIAEWRRWRNYQETTTKSPKSPWAICGETKRGQSEGVNSELILINLFWRRIMGYILLSSPSGWPPLVFVRCNHFDSVSKFKSQSGAQSSLWEVSSQKEGPDDKVGRLKPKFGHLKGKRVGILITGGSFLIKRFWIPSPFFFRWFRARWLASKAAAYSILRVVMLPARAIQLGFYFLMRPVTSAPAALGNIAGHCSVNCKSINLPLSCSKANTISRLWISQRAVRGDDDPIPKSGIVFLWFGVTFDKQHGAFISLGCFSTQRVPHAASNLKQLARCSQILSTAESSVLFIMHAALACPHE